MFSQGQEEVKLEWMYKAAHSTVDREEYLLGRSVDKTLEQINVEEKQQQLGVQPPKNHVEHECIPPSIRDYKKQPDDQVDMTAKLQEDPLVAIKKREEENRRQFLNNPVQIKKLQKALKSQKKKRDKQHAKSDSDEDLDEKLAKKLKLLKQNPDATKYNKSNKKFRKDNSLDTILMHKYNELKTKLSEDDLRNILQGNVSDSSSDSSSSSSDDEQKSSKKSSKKGPRNQPGSSSNSDSDRGKSAKHKKKLVRPRSRSNEPKLKDSKRKSRSHRRESGNYNKDRSRSRSNSKEGKSHRPRERVRSTSNDRKRRTEKHSSKETYYNRSKPEFDRRDRNRNASEENSDKRDRHSSSTKKYTEKARKKLRRDTSSSSSSSSEDRHDKGKQKKKNSGKKSKRDMTSSAEETHSKKRQESRNRVKENRKRKDSSSSESDAPKSSQKGRESPASSSEDSEGNPKNKKKNWGLVRADGTKLVSSTKHSEKTVTAQIDRKVPETKVPNYRSRIRLTEEEKEKKRKEMMLNGMSRDSERAQNLKQHREKELKEDQVRKDYDPDFIQKQLLRSANTSTVESRIRANINNIQRSGSDMNKHFSKR